MVGSLRNANLILCSYSHADMGRGVGRGTRIRGRGRGRNVVSSPSALVNSESLEESPTTHTSRIITNIFQERLHVMGYNWKMVPHDIKDFYWQEFQV